MWRCGIRDGGGTTTKGLLRSSSSCYASSSSSSSSSLKPNPFFSFAVIPRVPSLATRSASHFLYPLLSSPSFASPSSSSLLLSNQQRCSSSTTTSSHSNEDYITRRVQLWEEEEKRQKEERENGIGGEKQEIEIELPDGSKRSGLALETTPLEIAENISKGLARSVVIASVDGTPWDLSRPLEKSCHLKLIKFDDPPLQSTLPPPPPPSPSPSPSSSSSSHSPLVGVVNPKEVFWHSSSHLLGCAIEKVFGSSALLCDGPALVPDSSSSSSSISGGFFYDFRLTDGRKVSTDDFEKLEEVAKKVVKSGFQFSRLEVDREFCKKMFYYNPFKLSIIDLIPEGDPITLYRCGDFIDLCRGPHLPSTSKVKGFKLLKTSGTHWEGKDKENETEERVLLQRVYGISFPEVTQLKEWVTLREEAGRRDHRVLGKAQKLFMFHPLSPGNPFFLPHGTRVFQKLLEFIRGEYKERGYEEVITPQLFNAKLWQTSGHWEHYKDDMFFFGEESTHHHHSSSCAHGQKHEGTGQDHLITSATAQQELIGLKPMNCPGHCLIFKQTARSYRELPVRFADFSALHRNELAGALSGLTRVRRFHQDDAHIFCREDQLEAEIKSCLDFIGRVYCIFGFKFTLRLSTRPEKFIGSREIWDKAEEALKRTLEMFGHPWELNAGDGAFYGPKIDVAVTDALERKHQCATVQLDFQLPRRFELEYFGEDGRLHTPVIIHRAIFGSLERMLAIVLEHTAGKWPLWLSPRQCVVIPVSKAQNEYAEGVAKELRIAHNLFVDVSSSDTSLDKRILEAQHLRYNYMLVVGQKELESQTVSVRPRDTTATSSTSASSSSKQSSAAPKQPPVPLSEFVSRVLQEIRDFK